jgi:hypothetical protein
MTIHELAELAGRTRAAQKLYFDKRGGANLMAACRLEQQLDDAVADVLKTRPVQRPLFGPDAPEGSEL